jgi:hypothetical protein
MYFYVFLCIFMYFYVFMGLGSPKSPFTSPGIVARAHAQRRGNNISGDPFSRQKIWLAFFGGLILL